MLKIFKRRSIVLRVSHVNPFTAEKRLHEILGKRPINFEEVFEPFPLIGTNRRDLDQNISHTPNNLIGVIQQDA